MKLPDRLASQKALLLVEAVLSAVVIAVGLVFISRGLGGQLRSLEVVEAYDALLPLAESKLHELEALGLKQQVIPQNLFKGEFDEPHEGFYWELRAVAHPVPSGTPAFSDVSLAVYSEYQTKRKVTLNAVWPSLWIDGS